MGEVADLWASVGARVNQSQWAQADARLAGTRKAVDGLSGAFAGAFQDKGGRWRAASGRFLTLREKAQLAAAGVAGVGDAADKAAKRGTRSIGGLGAAYGALGAYVGGRAAYGALVKFNSTAEDARNQIAGMLALVKRTDLADQFGTADTLIANLTKRAATLPGTTADYISMLGMITQPITDAKLGMQDLEDITVGAAVAAKALGIDAEVAARDIDQAVRGQFKSVDQFTGKLLGAAGFKGEGGRARFNALSQQDRALKLKEVFTQKQITQLAEAQGKTFSGVLSTLQDSLQQFFGRVGKPLFEGLSAAIKSVNGWLEANQEKLKEVAAAVGGALVTAFQAFSSIVTNVFGFLAEHGEFTKSLLIGIGVVIAAFAVKAAVAWAIAFAPVVLAIAAVTAIVYAIRMLQKHPDKVRAAFQRMWDGIKGALSSVWSAMKGLGDRIWTFFTEDIPNAIKKAFKDAFDFIAGLPVIKQIIDTIKWVRDSENRGKGPPVIGGGLRELSPPAPTTPPAFGGGWREMSTPSVRVPTTGTGPTASISVQVGGINVNSATADPAAVAMQVGRVFDERMAGLLRQTMDVVG